VDEYRDGLIRPFQRWAVKDSSPPANRGFCSCRGSTQVAPGDNGAAVQVPAERSRTTTGERPRGNHGLFRLRQAADRGSGEATADAAAGKARKAHPATGRLDHAASGCAARVENGNVQSSSTRSSTVRRHSYREPGASGIGA
jgi:hypothetical protein